MCNFIGIESVAANALIEIYDKSKKNVVSFEILVRYGEKVAKQLKEITGEEPILLISRKYQYDMADNYPNYFHVNFGAPGQATIMLKEGFPTEKFKNNFRWSMSMNYVKAFMSEEAIRELGVMV